MRKAKLLNESLIIAKTPKNQLKRCDIEKILLNGPSKEESKSAITFQNNSLELAGVGEFKAGVYLFRYRFLKSFNYK